eukprot:4448032-Amphidinium_carterae.1
MGRHPTRETKNDHTNSKLYIEKLTAENQKLQRRNQEQKHEAIWIGRDATTGQHITDSHYLRSLASNSLEPFYDYPRTS